MGNSMDNVFWGKERGRITQGRLNENEWRTKQELCCIVRIRARSFEGVLRELKTRSILAVLSSKDTTH